MRITNVSYYFYLQFDDLQYPLAVINLFTFPDATLLSQSSQTVYLCNALEGLGAIKVIPITSIKSVVSMFTDLKVTPEGELVDTRKFALLRHPRSSNLQNTIQKVCSTKRMTMIQTL
jgi:hypothetical protein